MKKTILSLLALGSLLLAASCQREEPETGALTGEVDFSITAGIPGGLTTYAQPTLQSHLGGANNLDPDTYDLRYILEVWTDEETPELAYREVKTVESLTHGITFEARVLAKKYNFVFWADFVNQGSSEDLVYNTESLRNITYKASAPADRHPGKDDADAYYAVVPVDLTLSSQKIPDVTLKRPFGKIRLVSTDISALNENNKQSERPAVSVIKYADNLNLPSTFDALTGETSGSIDAGEFEFTAMTEDVIVGGEESTTYTGAYVLGYDYIFASATTPAYSFDVTVYSDADGTSQIGRRSLSNIPVSSNKLTTVIGNFYTNEGSIDVIVDDAFDEENTYDAETTVTRTFEEINQALAECKTKILFDQPISGQNEHVITIPDNAPESFSIDFGSDIVGTPTVKIKNNSDANNNISREITLITQTSGGNLILDISTENTTYIAEGKYYDIINHKATSLVKTMGYITKLTLYNGDAEIYANVGLTPTMPHNYITFNGTGVIKYVLVDSGAELSAYGKFANEGKCEKICLGKDVTYVKTYYLAGDVDLNGHTITMSNNSSGSTPYIYLENDLTIYNGQINCTNIDKTCAVFQIQGENVDLNLNNVDITSDINVFAAFKPGSITITDCEITTDYISVISTNASNQPYIDITISNSKLTGQSTILKNVPGTMTINDSDITGTAHGIIARGGDAIISNSTITLNYNDADNYSSELNLFKNANWGQGNEVPLAAMTIGNRSASAYQYPTNVTLKNTDIILSGTYGKEFPSIYAYANQSAGLGVTLTYDEDCHFDKAPELASANITVHGSSQWTGTTAEPIIDENAKTVTVNSAEQLAGLAKLVNSSENGNTFSGYTITLHSDIDLQNQTWTPIGNGSRGSEGGSCFSGVFDGNGHTIRNINVTEDRDNYGAGLFSVVNGGTVKNITIEGGSIKAFDYGAAVVGIMLGESTIENCHARNIEIHSDDVAAGIVARAYGTNNTITECTNSCNITTAKKAGGIVGIASNGGATKIENCSNSGTVYASDAGAAGILGYAGPATNSIISSSNTGTIGRITDKYAGGIVGYQASTDETAGLTIEECTNSGEISAINAGGIYGIPGSSQPVHISKSVNNGNVTGVDAAGGIACRAGSGTIKNCTNTANITAATENKGVAGGIAGNLGEAKIINCSGGGASAVITAQYPGRLVGHVANKPYSPDDVEASITIDDSNGDDYSNYKTIAAMGLYTAWSNINIEGGTLHGKPAIDGQASGYIKIHSVAAWDQYPDETGTWKCSPTDNNFWTKVN